MGVTIYHNPKCSKSRQTLQILEDKGVAPEIVLYLETPPTADEMKELLKKLGLRAADILRQAEAREAGLSGDMDEDALIKGMIAHPRCIERPIVVKGAKAVLGRPPENVLDLI
ncbi:MAG: arsenate reductase (glutaredoxin) [Rhodospirillales bacterium CG15_BIG_FIL_POST_REV_8_21_14_020_66_15]|nr:MAG: arsenate reductase (glutaredoxin) [Rhodospirillales bacterium CG15_BIG_FIL_POST_REV_8_21_14_020_66_15]